MFDWLISAVRPLQFKGKARVLKPFVPRVGIRSAIVNGYRITLDLSDHIQRMIYLGAYERWETHTVWQHLHPGMCVVDVGANVGYFTLLGARRVERSGRVFAVEPSPWAADRLEITLRDNQLETVCLEKCGVGRQLGEAILYDPLPDNHSPTMVGNPGTPGRVVPIHTLDDLAAKWSVERIDLLKVDVEGYEPEVFAGSNRLLNSGRIGAILCEFNAHWLVRAGSSPDAMYRNLLVHGFEDQTRHPFDPEVELDSRFLVHR